MANGELKPLLGTVGKYGFAAAVAAFLIWWMTATLAKNQADILTATRATQAAQAEANTEMSGFATRQERDEAKRLALLRLICQHTARTDAQRTACSIGY